MGRGVLLSPELIMNEETLFHLALDRPPGERVAFVEELCGGDPVLRQRVRVLLHAHDNPGSFLARPALDTDPTHGGASDTDPAGLPAALAPGGWIGPYHLLRLIGEGGMG